MRRQTDAVPARIRALAVPAACAIALLAPAAALADPVPSDDGTATTSPPAARKSPSDLALGDSGSKVLALQKTLWQVGLPVARDGNFGPATELMLRRYEHEEGLPVDGVADSAQRISMRKRAHPQRAEKRFASRTLKVGASGTDVRAIQRLLLDNGIRVPTHGKYTAAVRSRVQQWERKADMTPDGVLSRPEARTLRQTAPPPPAAGSAPASTLGGSGAKVGDDGYAFPIQGRWHYGDAGTYFGERGGAHQGVDAFASCGTPLVAASSGKVAHNQVQSAAGNYLVITGTPTGEDQAYMHMKARSPLKEGTAVKAGDPIGLVGDTGNADGCHLHFELWSKPGWYTGGKPRDPKPDLDRWSKAVGNPPTKG
ncbi:peptidase M23B [Patulibacter medicamentivorans]|uniref:Peptidase M23B n=1 Tax=Patulibacter medicamentivorans TaxID=1097667 RepID=H0E3B0_9ACTN|nr:peptidoglycan DD-metalloendopeptidase family protein [Patulibacter medicamentivorans]EHN11834.1 peptidase M23B [Patulibacter medicamentivorans]